jgi:hypothetical protein
MQTKDQHEELFLFLWGISSLFQLFALSAYRSVVFGSTLGLVEFAIIAPALWLTIKPSSRKAAFILLVLHCAAFVLRAPMIPSHRTTVFVTHVAMCAAWCSILLSRKYTKGDWFLLFQSYAQPVVIAVYFFACFHKLNEAFLSVAHSCASAFYLRFAAWFPLAINETWAAQTAIYATLLVEGLLPVALLWKRTRFAAVLVAVLFHSILSADYHQHTMDFSSIMFALLILFLSPQEIKAARSLFAEENGQIFTQRLKLILISFFVGTFALGFLATTPEWALFYEAVKHGIWYSFAALVLFTLIRIWPNRSPAALTSSGLKPAPSLYWAPLGVTLFIGILPYLGLHQRSSFDMYSNLKIIGNQSNHLIWRTPLDPFGFTADLVQVHSSSIPEFSEGQSAVSQPGLALPYFEFQSVVSRYPEAKVSYTRGGQRFEVSRIADEPSLATPPSWILRKLLWFRRVDLQGLGTCQW